MLGILINKQIRLIYYDAHKSFPHSESWELYKFNIQKTKFQRLYYKLSSPDNISHRLCLYMTIKYAPKRLK